MRVRSLVLSWLSALVAAGAGADAVHFANGDRLTGQLVAAPDGFVAIDVPHVGVVTVPNEQVERVDSDVAAEQPAVRWETRADLGMVVTSGNTRTEDASVVVGAKRTGERFDNVLGLAVNRSAARADANSPKTKTKDQMDVSYALRWKFSDAWYGVANVNHFRDPIKDIEWRYTAGAGIGHTFWQSARGSLSTDAGVSQVFERIELSRKEANPALRWSLDFQRWLVLDRVELFHNNQLLHILTSERGLVWNSDTGIRFYLNDHWDASLRLDLQHETAPSPGRARTDASYALAVGVKL